MSNNIGENESRKPKSGGPLQGAAAEKDIRQLLQGLPEDKQNGIKAALIQVQGESERFSGPFPYPKHVAEYEKYCPNFLERLLIMAENDNNSATSLQGKLVQAEIENEKQKRVNERLGVGAQAKYGARGQWFGFVAFVFSLSVLCSAGVILALAGHEKTAIGLFIGSGGVFLAVFKAIRDFLSANKMASSPEK